MTRHAGRARLLWVACSAPDVYNGATLALLPCSSAAATGCLTCSWPKAAAVLLRPTRRHGRRRRHARFWTGRPLTAKSWAWGRRLLARREPARRTLLVGHERIATVGTPRASVVEVPAPAGRGHRHSRRARCGPAALWRCPMAGCWSTCLASGRPPWPAQPSLPADRPVVRLSAASSPGPRPIGPRALLCWRRLWPASAKPGCRKSVLALPAQRQLAAREPPACWAASAVSRGARPRPGRRVVGRGLSRQPASRVSAAGRRRLLAGRPSPAPSAPDRA